jgi:hypothetical protein
LNRFANSVIGLDLGCRCESCARDDRHLSGEARAISGIWHEVCNEKSNMEFRDLRPGLFFPNLNETVHST